MGSFNKSASEIKYEDFFGGSAAPYGKKAKNAKKAAGTSKGAKKSGAKDAASEEPEAVDRGLVTSAPARNDAGGDSDMEEDDLGMSTHERRTKRCEYY